MDELEFRRRCIADPDERDEAFRRAKRASAERGRLAEQRKRIDRVLSDAMQIEVPEGLAARILLRQSLECSRERRRTVARTYALAASVLLALGLGLALLLAPQTYRLEREVLTHINSELHHLTEQQNPATAELGELLARFGADLQGELGQVSYAGTCAFRRQHGIHMVLRGERGPVTVLILPGETLDDITDVSDTRFTGVIIPIPNGSMAIVGEQGEPIERLERRLRSAVVWEL